MDTRNFGVITEQGDLGLGFDQLNEQENAVVENAVNKEKGLQTLNEEEKK